MSFDMTHEHPLDPLDNHPAFRIALYERSSPVELRIGKAPDERRRFLAT
jgi:hypothetical protein